MSQRLLIANLQASRIPSALNICPTDDRFYQWASEAENLMLGQGRWWGSVREAQFCVDSGCIVLPPQVAVVERMNICGRPIDVTSPWYPFTRILATWNHCTSCSSQAGLSSGQCSQGHYMAQLREMTMATYATTLGANKLIRSYPGSDLDIGKKIIYQGKNINGVWVRSIIDGVMQDGEQVALTLPFVDTTTVWAPGSPVAVIKESTNTRVLVYEYDTVTHLERQLAEYEANETRPSYRVCYVPGLVGAGGCCNCSTDGDTTRKTVTAMVSLQHVPFTSPNDWCILQNLSAYKAAMMAVKAWEEGDVAKGNYYFYGSEGPGRNARGVTRVVNRGGAIPLLQAELRKMTGDKVNAFVYTDESDKFARMTLGFR